MSLLCGEHLRHILSDMSDNFSITETTANGKPCLRVNISRKVAKKQVRKYFPIGAEVVATSWANAFIDRIVTHGTASLNRPTGSETVSGAVAQFFKLFKAEGNHLRLLHFYLDKFKAIHGEWDIKSITGLDLMAFWSRKWRRKGAKEGREWGQNSKRQALAYLRVFFNWCERHDMVDRNPARRADPPKPERTERAILTPGEMAELLEKSESMPEMRAYLCLGGFAGLRTSEILSGKIVIEENEIHVLDGKTGGRYVAKMPVFAHWMPEKYDFPKEEKNFRKRREKLVGSTDIGKWPNNCLRHSFASYHLATGEDAGKTAYQLGHTSPQMVYKAYARAVKKADAEKWWALGLPEKLDEKANKEGDKRKE